MLKKGRSLSGHERNCGFLNLSGSPLAKNRFANISAVSGLDLADDGRGLALIDWDYDGDQDIWTSNRNAPRVRFMRNDTITGNHFLAVRLIGNGITTNRDAIGARVEVELGGVESQETAPHADTTVTSETQVATSSATRPMIKTLRAGEGYISQNSRWLHFGLGRADQIKKVTVHWPGGQVEEFSPLEPNHHYELVQGQGTPHLWQTPQPAIPLEAKPPTIFPSTDKARSPLVTLMPMPWLQYRDFDNHEQTLNFGNGKPVLINLWASWCVPCLQELKEFTDHEEKLREANLNIVALAVDGLGADKSDPAIARQQIEAMKFPFAAGHATPQLIQTLQKIHDIHIPLQNPLPIPSSFLIDAEGRLSVIYKGPVSVENLIADLRHSRRSREQRLEQTVALSGQSIEHPRVRMLMNRDDARLLYHAVRTTTQLGDFEAAKRTYEEIIRLTPDFAQAHGKLGIICLQLHQEQLAEKHLLEAVRLDPTLAAALYNLGAMNARAGRTSDAEQYFRRAVESNPNLTEAHFNLAVILFNQRRFSIAKLHLDKALALKPNNVQILYNRGFVNAALGQYEMAVRDYSTVIQVRPDFSAAYKGRAKASALMQHYESAVRDLSKLIQLQPQDADAFYTRGKIHQTQGQTKKALDDYTKVIQLLPKHVMAHNNAAWILATSSQKNIRDAKRAVASAQQACSTSQADRYDLLDTLAAAYAEDKQFQKAVESQTKAITLAPASSKPELLTRLKLYQAGKPFRQGNQSDP